MKARVDKNICIGSAVCISIAPEVFELNDEAQAQVVNPDISDEDLLRNAAENCPVQAIILEDEQGNKIYP